MRDQIIKDRIKFVAGMPNRDDLPGMLEQSLATSKVYNPSNCLRSACSTEAEEEASWVFMHVLKGCAPRCIEVARKVVGKQLEERFGIKADWDAIRKITDRGA